MIRLSKNMSSYSRLSWVSILFLVLVLLLPSMAADLAHSSEAQSTQSDQLAEGVKDGLGATNKVLSNLADAGKDSVVGIIEGAELHKWVLNPGAATEDAALAAELMHGLEGWAQKISELHLGQFSQYIGTGLKVLKLGTLVSDLLQTYKTKGFAEALNQAMRNLLETSAGTLGGAAGKELGQWLGGAIGSLGGPVGTAVGIFAGSIIGTWAGEKLAKMGADALYDSSMVQSMLKAGIAYAQEHGIYLGPNAGVSQTGGNPGIGGNVPSTGAPPSGGPWRDVDGGPIKYRAPAN